VHTAQEKRRETQEKHIRTHNSDTQQ